MRNRPYLRERSNMSKPVIILGVLGAAIAAAVAIVFSKRGSKSPDSVPTSTPGVVAIPPSARLQALLGTKWKGTVTDGKTAGLIIVGYVGKKLDQGVDEDGKPTQSVTFKGAVAVPGVSVGLPFDGWINHAGSVSINGRKGTKEHYVLSGKLASNNKTLSGKGDGVLGGKSRSLTFTMKRV